MPTENEPSPSWDLTDTQVAAATLHELFLAWTEAGFTPEQAMYLLGQYVQASVSTYMRGQQG